ncbi:exosome complex component RRP46 [Tribolium castaneum]|uniref:Exosome complex component RRP46 n=1 Tax=Tribolium castaneum TaxID=7070 RepID=D6WTI2_TRICA|nr:PREDICTED: exosome complex component RRP46 [Tribolium castaneum]EFA07181.2 Exosome complex component RRP46-like Protein [Tribolium castaneum]|eukprot:XP_008196414.1 PREDICTED: exosome complex component RRP46 [Tribolium castaneum]
MSKLKSSCKLGILSRPDGSVLFSQDETTVVAGVYGPVESKANKALVEKACVEAHFRPKSGLPGVKDRLNESIIRNVCEAAIATAMYPRTSVVVVIQEMQNNGQLISCALNAACLALLDSGIDMKCMFAAVTCFIHKDESLVFTPPINEDQVKAMFMFVFDSVEKSIIASHTDGSFSVEQYKDALSLCKEECANMFDFFKKSLTIK